MKKKSHRSIFVFILSLALFSTAFALAQNKVVVIPLIKTVEAPLVPFTPLAAASQPNIAYGIGT